MESNSPENKAAMSPGKNLARPLTKTGYVDPMELNVKDAPYSRQMNNPDGTMGEMIHDPKQYDKAEAYMKAEENVYTKGPAPLVNEHPIPGVTSSPIMVTNADGTATRMDPSVTREQLLQPNPDGSKRTKPPTEKVADVKAASSATNTSETIIK